MDPVYEPREDSYLLQKHVKEYANGAVLDMGTGSGILSVEAAKTASRVTAADINPAAISFCKKHYQNSRITFIRSDLFSALKGKSFDLITFNPPYLPTDRRAKDVALDGGKHGYELIVRFIKEVANHLEQNGKVLLLFSSYSKKDKIDQAISENALAARLLDTQKLDFETLYVYLIQKSALRDSLESLKVKDIRYLASGQRGDIYTGIWRRQKVAIKAERAESKAMNRIGHEAMMLQRVNKRAIGPKFLYSAKGFVIYRFVQGEFIVDYIGHSRKPAILSMLCSVMLQLYALDEMGISKAEMTHPPKHILVQKNVKPVLIDFERARFTQKPDNVTQFCQYLIRLTPMLRKKKITLNKDKLIAAAKTYSMTKDITPLMGLLS
jgi:release factor glutamine methyltransferase